MNLDSEPCHTLRLNQSRTRTQMNLVRQLEAQNEMFTVTFDIDRDSPARECHKYHDTSRLYTGTVMLPVRTDCPQHSSSNFQLERLKIKLKYTVTSLLFAIGAVFKNPQSNSKVCAASCALAAPMPRSGRLPVLQTQKIQEIQKFQNACTISSGMHLESASEKSHFCK